MNTVIVRALPVPIHQSQAKDVFTYLAGKLSEGNSRSAGEIFDRALFTAACRAAIKGGDKNTDLDNKQIIEEIFTKSPLCLKGQMTYVKDSIKNEAVVKFLLDNAKIK